MNTNMIWIELRTDIEDDDERETYLRKTNRLLVRLGLPEYYRFWWHDAKEMYCITTSEAGCFMYCDDPGHWFNLDYIDEQINA